MKEAICCSCCAPISGIKMEIYIECKEVHKLEDNDIFEILDVTKECCKLKFLTVAHYIKYLK